MRVLLVEDHHTMRDLIADHLRQRGFAVDAVESAEDALSANAAAAYDAAILDLGLPDMDGLDLLQRLRSGHTSALPAVILTARDSVEDRVCGLNAGADDYLVKPFNLGELEARLRAVLRRPGARQPVVLALADLSFDTASRSATIGETAVALSRREAALLEELIGADGRIVVRDALEERLYGFDDDVSGNALEASVSRLRRKLVAAGSCVGIEALRGIGYRLIVGSKA